MRNLWTLHLPWRAVPGENVRLRQYSWRKDVTKNFHNHTTDYLADCLRASSDTCGDSDCDTSVCPDPGSYTSTHRSPHGRGDGSCYTGNYISHVLYGWTGTKNQSRTSPPTDRFPGSFQHRNLIWCW